MNLKSPLLLVATILSGAHMVGVAHADVARGYAYVVGSSTVLPFAEEVANHIVKGGKLKRPLFEPNGTNGGFTMFCEGVGMEYPDIVNASRSIKQSEFAACQSNGVGEIVEAKIGYDGIVIASNKKAPPMDLTRKELYLALSKQVPDPACKQPCDTLVANPYKTWKQINPALPDVKIEVVGPPVNSGTMEVFAEAVTEAGCDTYPALAAKRAKNLKEYHRICHNLRDDNVYTEETSENIASQLESRPDAVGIFNYNRFKENASRLQAAKLDGVAPSYDSIATQTYPIARPLFFYLKKAHIGRVAGLQAYVTEFTSEKALGQKGYLAGKGLITMSPQEQKRYTADMKALKPMVLDVDHRP